MLRVYSCLYSVTLDSSERSLAMEEFIGLLSDNIPESAKSSLSNPISEQELKLAIDAMALNKCPGLDGIITKFYKKIGI